jgi:AraC family transcriptional regulator
MDGAPIDRRKAEQAAARTVKRSGIQDLSVRRGHRRSRQGDVGYPMDSATHQDKENDYVEEDHPELRFAEAELKPRLFFFDRDLWDTALKLKAQVESPTPGSRLYAEALGNVMAHELLRLENGAVAPKQNIRGGLAGWQKRKLTEYIEEHLAEDISLPALAEIADLSPFHFARAFKQSFGLPPHRYLVSRRIEKAKNLLATPALPVTRIGLDLGFGEASSFTTAFRKHAGLTPTEYRRSL